MVRSRRPRGTRRARARPRRWSRSRACRGRAFVGGCGADAVARARRSGARGRADRLGGSEASHQCAVRAGNASRFDQQAPGDPGAGLGDSASTEALDCSSDGVSPSQEPSWRGERKRCQRGDRRQAPGPARRDPPATRAPRPATSRPTTTAPAAPTTSARKPPRSIRNPFTCREFCPHPGRPMTPINAQSQALPWRGFSAGSN
jgi:hypothetical protein